MSQRVLLCLAPAPAPDDVTAIAAALRAGVKHAAPDAVFDALPLADGGDGSAAVAARYLAPEIVDTIVPDAHGALGPARWLRWGDHCALLEAAEICRLSQRAPLTSSTFGVGAVIAQAIASGARTIYVAAGGAVPADAGAGALIALGAELRDARGRVLGPTPRSLHAVAEVDTRRVAARLAGVRLVVLSDHRSPLGTNAAGFGRHRGVTAGDASIVDAMLASLDRLGRLRGKPLLATPWLAAGGGLAAGLAAFAGARVLPGADFFLGLAGFDARARAASLILTADGAGTLAHAVATRAAQLGATTATVAAATLDELTEAARAIAADRLGHAAAARARPAPALRLIRAA